MDVEDDRLETIRRKALELGAADARVISAGEIPVEEGIVELCKPPQCDGYEQSANCPPNVMSPEEFRHVLEEYESAVIFKIEAPMEMLLSDDRDHVGRLIQQTAARLEGYAREEGFPAARALAGDNCKRLFCHEHERCNILSGAGECRNPDVARLSMSGVGVNFNKLNRTLGWQMGPENPDAGEPVGWMAGMVLLG